MCGNVANTALICEHLWDYKLKLSSSKKKDVYQSWEMIFYCIRSYCIHGIWEQEFKRLVFFFSFDEKFLALNTSQTWKQYLHLGLVEAQPLPPTMACGGSCPVFWGHRTRDMEEHFQKPDLNDSQVSNMFPVEFSEWEENTGSWRTPTAKWWT